jgi:hypothetical protein
MSTNTKSLMSGLRPAVFLTAALALGGCASTSAPGSAAGAASQGTTAGTSGMPSGTPAPGTSSAPTAPAAPTASHSAEPPAGPTSSDLANSDSYAWFHPCAIEQLTVTVTPVPDAPSQRIIAVRNNGSASCGLSYYPQVYLDNSHNPGGQKVKPMVPGGLGGPPSSPVYAHKTAYAVIALDPSGATAGTVPGIDEIVIVPDGDHMPSAAAQDFALGAGAHVLKPKMGLYERSVDDALASMRAANTQL